MPGAVNFMMIITITILLGGCKYDPYFLLQFLTGNIINSNIPTYTIQVC